MNPVRELLRTARELLAIDEPVAQEIFLYIYSNMPERIWEEYAKNLITKKARGVYDSNKAAQLMMYLVERAVKEYAKYHLSKDTKWHEYADKPTRLEIAKRLVKRFEEEAEEGTYEHLLPKKYQKKAAEVSNPLDGKNNQQAKRIVNRMIGSAARGIFRDESWQGVRRVWKALETADIPSYVTSAEYRHNENGVPNGKVWAFEVPFINDRGRKTTLFGTVVAGGAGSTNEPLSRYDVVAYVG